MASETDKNALLSLIQGTEGKVWSSEKNGWSSKSLVPVCEWEGITCKVGMSGALAKVTTIRLPDVGLSGTLPTELGKLTFLEELNLKGNLIQGSIPSDLAALPKLSLLDLSDCLLTGTLPDRFESPILKKLLLSENGISGQFFVTRHRYICNLSRK